MGHTFVRLTEQLSSLGVPALSFLDWAFRQLELDEIVSPLDIGASVPPFE